MLLCLAGVTPAMAQFNLKKAVGGAVKAAKAVTLTDEQIQQLKEVAEKNNRSMESQVRSILEEWLAGTVAHEITRKTNFYDEIREFMKNMDFEGLDKGELPLSERNSADSRPPVSFE